MDWNDSYIASAFLPIETHLFSRARYYCNSGPPRRIVQPAISICSDGSVHINFRKVISHVCSQNVEDDGLTFLPDTIRVERIRDEEAYEGVRVRVEARLGDVRIPLQIDIGLGDTIVPASEELAYLRRPTRSIPLLNAEIRFVAGFDHRMRRSIYEHTRPPECSLLVSAPKLLQSSQDCTNIKGSNSSSYQESFIPSARGDAGK